MSKSKMKFSEVVWSASRTKQIRDKQITAYIVYIYLFFMQYCLLAQDSLVYNIAGSISIFTTAIYVTQIYSFTYKY